MALELSDYGRQGAGAGRGAGPEADASGEMEDAEALLGPRAAKRGTDSSYVYLILHAAELVLLVTLTALVVRGQSSRANIDRKGIDRAGGRSVVCWRTVADLRNLSDTRFRDDELDGLQGLAIVEGSSVLFESHTAGMRVLQLHGSGSRPYLSHDRTRHYHLSSDLPSIPTNPQKAVTHIGGISFSRATNSLWLAVHNHHSSAGALMEVATNTLDATGQVLLPTDGKPFDWVAIDNERDVGYAAEFSHIRCIRRFNATTLLEMPALQLKLPPQHSAGLLYIQSGTIGSGGVLMLLGDDYSTTLYSIDPSSGALLSQQALLLGGEVDGLEYVPAISSLMVGINRMAHEKVRFEGIMQLKPFVELIDEIIDQSACDGSMIIYHP